MVFVLPNPKKINPILAKSTTFSENVIHTFDWLVPIQVGNKVRGAAAEHRADIFHWILGPQSDLVLHLLIQKLTHRNVRFLLGLDIAKSLGHRRIVQMPDFGVFASRLRSD